jgi:5-methyltetrahydropteroyltriglutamate--homocysteine methyltransferase
MPSDLSAMLRAQEAGQPYDAQVLQKRLASAVAEAVKMQAEQGLDIITDGEQSKPSFTTYLSHLGRRPARRVPGHCRGGLSPPTR